MMGLFVIQLAKMTLVVLGIFFTPLITRKFAASMNLPVSQSMMKWGGLAWAATTAGVGVAAARVGSAATLTKNLAKEELPSASFHGSRWFSSRISGMQNSPNSRTLSGLQGISSVISKADNKIQRSHLIDQARKEGLHVPTRSEIRQSKVDPQMRERVEHAQSHLDSFIRSKSGTRNPITNQLEGQYVPPSGRIVRGVESFSNTTQRLVNAVRTQSILGKTGAAPQPHIVRTIDSVVSSQPTRATPERIRQATSSNPRHIKEILEKYKENRK